MLPMCAEAFVLSVLQLIVKLVYIVYIALSNFNVLFVRWNKRGTHRNLLPNIPKIHVFILFIFSLN